MADIRGLNSMILKEIFLEREDTQQAADSAAHTWNSAFAPSPGLGGDEVHNRDPPPMEPARDPKVEIGRIGEDRKVGRRIRGSQQLAVFAINARNVPDHFDEADYSEAGRIDYRADTGGAQSRAGTTKKLRAREQLCEFGHHEGGI
jgi:hypothetical protein